MNNFEQDKAERLKRKAGLRLFYYLGAVTFRKDKYDMASIKLRLLHPVTWIYIPVMVLYSILIQGIPATWDDIKYFWKSDSIWW